MAQYNKIFLALRAGGLTEDAVWAVMGNLNCESNLESCRLQGDFQTGYPASRSYAQAVDSGSKSKEAFATDAKGWGLAQWTYPSRKRALWDYAKAEKKSIADLELQLAFLLKELREDFASLYRFLQQTNNMYEATDRFCREFENPAVKNVSARYSSAQWLKANVDVTASPPDQEPSPAESERQGTSLKPKTVSIGMTGTDVTLLQALLTLRGYPAAIDGIFGKETDNKLRQFQADSADLTIDGICGPQTWKEILKY